VTRPEVKDIFGRLKRVFPDIKHLFGESIRTRTKSLSHRELLTILYEVRHGPIYCDATRHKVEDVFSDPIQVGLCQIHPL
jgi:hypothetical protein